MDFYKERVNVAEDWDEVKGVVDRDRVKAVELCTPYVEGIARQLLCLGGVKFYGGTASLKGFNCNHDDVVQYGLVHVLSELGKYDPARSSFAGWLRNVAVNGMVRGVFQNEYGMKHGVNLMERARRELRAARWDKREFVSRMVESKVTMTEYRALMLYDLLVESKDVSGLVIVDLAPVEHGTFLRQAHSGLVQSVNKLTGPQSKVVTMRTGFSSDGLDTGRYPAIVWNVAGRDSKGKRVWDDVPEDRVSQLEVEALRAVLGNDWMDKVPWK